MQTIYSGGKGCFHTGWPILFSEHTLIYKSTLDKHLNLSKFENYWNVNLVQKEKLKSSCFIGRGLSPPS